MDVFRLGLSTRRDHDDFSMLAPPAIDDADSYYNAFPNNDRLANTNTSVEIEYIFLETHCTASLYRH